MIVKLIQIGTSKGVRLPSHIIKKYAFEGEMELIEDESGIKIKPISKVRLGWENAIVDANNSGEDDDFSDFISVSNDFDSSDWHW